MNRPTILLADDYVAFFDLLRRLLEPEFEVVGTVVNGQALVEAAVSLTPDVIVSDIRMPILSGLDALRRLIPSQPNVRFIFLTVYDDPVLIEAAQRAGASGYVDKIRADSDLVPAIRKALREGTFFLSKFGT